MLRTERLFRNGSLEVFRTSRPGQRNLELVKSTVSPAWAQDTAEQETAHRRAVLAHLPPDAAQRLFGLAVAFLILFVF